MSNGFATTVRQRNGHRKRYGTADIRRFIDLANSVPAEAELPDPTGGMPLEHCKEDWFPAFLEILDRFPAQEFPVFRNFIGQIDPEDFPASLHDYEEFPPSRSSERPLEPKEFQEGLHDSALHGYVAYLELRDTRQLLRSIAAMDKTKLARGTHFLATFPQTLLRVRQNERGGLDMVPTKLLRVLSDTDVSRIRECPVCKRIFWAKRKHKVVCSDHCRQRKWCKAYPKKWGAIQSRHEQRRAERERKEEQGRAVELKTSTVVMSEREVDRSKKRSPRLPVPR